MTALDKQVGGNHYKTLKVQPIEYITKNQLGWCEGNIVKYITRWSSKGGINDIDKVIHYAELLKEMHDKPITRPDYPLSGETSERVRTVTQRVASPIATEPVRVSL